MGAAISSVTLDRSRGTASRSPARAEPQRSPAPWQSSVHRLQRTVGNRVVHRLVSTIQPKLTVNPPNDEYEREADRVADQVMRMPGQATRANIGSAPPSIQRVCPECEEELQRTPDVAARPPQGLISRMCTACERERRDHGADAIQRQQPMEEEQEEDEPRLLQTKRGSSEPPEASSWLDSYLARTTTSGRRLPESTRAYFEPRFGRDFSAVRVHTDDRAAAAAKKINAIAFATGSHIHFARGRFQPGLAQGDRLLAHELTHVAQQGNAPLRDPGGGGRELQRPSGGHRVMRSTVLDSTVSICRRALTSRTIKVSQGGLRVVLLLKPLDTDVAECENHTFWVTLTRSVDWGFDDDIATCEAQTGGTRSFSFGNLPTGNYYVTIRRAFDHPYCCIEGDILALDEPLSDDSSGCRRDEGLSTMDIVHGALDLAGFIPVLGAIPDGINAGIYVLEGDWANAGLSAIAMAPGWGDGVKLGAIAGKKAVMITEKAAFKLGEEGIAKGLKEVKAASKAEKAAAKAEAHVAEGATKAEKEAVERAEKEAAEKAEKEAAEKKKKDEGQKKTCVTQFPLALNCARLPFDFKFPSQQAALAALKILTGKKNLRLVNPSPSTGGPCPGIGTHHGVKDGNDYIASISCCPCCTDTPAGPKMVTRCRILPH